MMKKLMITANLASLLLLTITATAFAGNLDSPGDPADGSGMPTTTGIYNQLDSGTASTPAASFQEPTVAPGSSGRSLGEIKGKLPVVDDTNGATASEVLSGKTFWGLDSGSWGVQPGSMPTQFLNDSSAAVSSGYYSSTTLDAVDADLSSSNIKRDVTIFGVTGESNVVDTGSGDAVATDLAVGKKAWVDGVEIEGTQPVCAFTLRRNRWCGDDEITSDATTGLVWQQQDDNIKRDFYGGRTYCNSNSANLSGTGWRLPSRGELLTLVDMTYLPTIDPIAFPMTNSDCYWTNELLTEFPTVMAMSVWFSRGDASPGMVCYARCVR